ncbi:hypothetical protein DFH08DRAFT_404528 [Mycena albidolilacea]|uniref:Uncharacterized protein n=1 Tax=Mycena albidolilacea TaxID=1033008 RepID=A0AAD7AIQ3_9AGAR|nr:hypothetical protein DFH08DRAFT_404528 [Mycena albidolilacea]
MELGAQRFAPSFSALRGTRLRSVSRTVKRCVTRFRLLFVCCVQPIFSFPCSLWRATLFCTHGFRLGYAEWHPFCILFYLFAYHVVRNVYMDRGIAPPALSPASATGSRVLKSTLEGHEAYIDYEAYLEMVKSHWQAADYALKAAALLVKSDLRSDDATLWFAYAQSGGAGFCVSRGTGGGRGNEY